MGIGIWSMHSSACWPPAIAGILEAHSSRANDLTARIGGEEFGIILPSTPIEGGRHLAETIRLAVEAMVLKFTITRPIQITVSIGVGSFNPSPGDSVAAFFESADKALYEAKRSGRNRVCIARKMAHTLSVVLD